MLCSKCVSVSDVKCAGLTGSGRRGAACWGCWLPSGSGEIEPCPSRSKPTNFLRWQEAESPLANQSHEHITQSHEHMVLVVPVCSSVERCSRSCSDLLALGFDPAAAALSETHTHTLTHSSWGHSAAGSADVWTNLEWVWRQEAPAEEKLAPRPPRKSRPDSTDSSSAAGETREKQIY